jgi:hypothetical protein
MNIAFASSMSWFHVLPVVATLLAEAPASVPPAGTDPSAPPPASAATDPEEPPRAYPDSPPTGTPPPTAQPARMPRHLWLALPFIGIQWIQNCEGYDCVTETGPGLRIGAIVGLRASDHLSLNGEIVYDAINGTRAAGVPNDAPGFYNFQVAVAPFFHAPLSPTAELLIGPKIGFFHLGPGAIGTHTKGAVLGVNVGGFFRISNVVALGALLNFDFEDEVKFDPGPVKARMISATVAALF